MRNKSRYPVHDTLPRIAQVDPDAVLRRADLPPDFFVRNPDGVTADQFYRLWSALYEEANREDFALYFGQAMARSVFATPLFAFSCSPDVRTGLLRLSLFKPLVAPVHMEVAETPETLKTITTPRDSSITVPASLQAFEAVYLVSCIRNHTVTDVAPVSITLGGTPDGMADLEAFFGCPVHIGPGPLSIELRQQDAALPLLSENAELWQVLEEKLNMRLRQWAEDLSASERVRNALIELLPSGKSSIEAVCKRLATSTRSLQRELRDQGVTFREVLDATRTELSLGYLRDGEINIDEISYLLAYRDPNSFYRAFQGWTGMTPSQARQQANT